MFHGEDESGVWLKLVVRLFGTELLNEFAECWVNGWVVKPERCLLFAETERTLFVLLSNVFDLFRRVEYCWRNFDVEIGSDSVEKLVFRSCSNLARRLSPMFDQDFFTLVDFFDDEWSRSYANKEFEFHCRPPKFRIAIIGVGPWNRSFSWYNERYWFFSQMIRRSEQARCFRYWVISLSMLWYQICEQCFGLIKQSVLKAETNFVSRLFSRKRRKVFTCFHWLMNRKRWWNSSRDWWCRLVCSVW